MRLIDADAFKKILSEKEMQHDKRRSFDEYSYGAAGAYEYAGDLLDEQPTVERPHENVAKEAIKEIREMCWGYDIPSPCCPEYREHHEQMQKIIWLCDSWLKKLKEGDEK